MEIPVSHLVRDHFLIAVLEKEAQRLKKLLDEIQDQHALRHGSRAFLLDGAVVWNSDAGAAKVAKKKPLDSEFQVEARKLVKKQNKLRLDAQRLKNFFAILARHCETYQDYRDVFPDFVVERMDIHEIQGLSRTREPGYVFASDPAKQKVFQNGLDLINSYLVNLLVF